MKYCPICLQPHEERGDACSAPECKRRLRNHKSSVRSGQRRAVVRIGQKQEQIATEKKRWRDIAMGRNAGERLKEIFGFNPEERDG